MCLLSNSIFCRDQTQRGIKVKILSSNTPSFCPAWVSFCSSLLYFLHVPPKATIFEAEMPVQEVPALPSFS